MKRKGWAAVLTAAALVVGVVGLVWAYRSGDGFQPFDTVRELHNNQILFPDSDRSSGSTNTSGDNSYWDDRNGEDGGQNGPDSGYLFGQSDQLPDGTPTGVVDGSGGNSNGNTVGGNVFEITDGSNGDADIILPGGNTGGNNGGNTGGDSGSGQPDDPDTPVGPVPGYGSASKDQTSTGYVRPTFAGSSDEHYGSSTSEKLEKNGDYEVRFTKAYSANFSAGEALYQGQKDVGLANIFQSLEAFVWDRTMDRNYYWTLDDLYTGPENADTSYVRIDGVSFGYFGGDVLTDFPMDIPEDEYYVKIYISYRLSLEDDWTSYMVEDLFGPSEGVAYELMKGRVVLLDTPLKAEGEIIDPAHIVNLYSQYVDTWTDSLNLLSFQEKLLGKRGTQLESLFPGWLEDGEETDFNYTVSTGRHVLEPAVMVPLDEQYQVEMRSYWMTPGYEVVYGSNTDYSSTYLYLQTLTDYFADGQTGGYVERLTVLEYVQAVQMGYYPGLTVDYLDLPRSVLYVDTNGVPTYDDDWLLYDRGLMVREGYSIEEGGLRYTSEDGILYNLDKTQMLGVPTGRSSLTVPTGVTKVVLPYQNRLRTLVLEDVSTLPEINYQRLRRSCRIIVPDDQLLDFLASESEMLQRTGLTVAPASQPDEGYTLRDNFLLTADDQLHQILRSSARWVALPDYITGVEQEAVQSFLNQLQVILLPESGEPIPFEEGCFDGFEKITIACWSDEQMLAAEELRSQYPDCTFTIRRIVARDDGYTYLNTSEGVLLCGVPEGLITFSGYIPGLGGEEDIPVRVISEKVFADDIQLRWVILPQHVKAIGYEAFANCTNLEGVFIDSRDDFLLAESAFENCSLLRFVGSNAPRMVLEDTELSLPAGGVFPNYSFLLCPADAETGYNGNWTAFTDVDHYELVDIGGSYMLYGADEENTRWLAIRSGARVGSTVTLPEDTTLIYIEAFRNAHTDNDSAFDLNWSRLIKLTTIADSAFAQSDLGEDVTLAPDLTIRLQAFAGCEKLRSIYLPGRSEYGVGGLTLSDELFYECKSLTTVRFGDFSGNGGIGSSAFAGSGLQNLIFEGLNPPVLTYYSVGFPFYFEYDQEDAGRLRITVPEGQEENYLVAWRCNIAGYVGENGRTDYQAMWDRVASDLYDLTWTDPTPQEVQQVVDEKLLAAENRLRVLLGMETVDTVTKTYYYTVDEDGFITLDATQHAGTWTDLSAETMDLPYGWVLDYVGADAFAGSPELRTVSVPNTLVAMHHNAFRGITFDSEDETDGLTLYMNSWEDIFGLLVEQEGVPFSFGVEDSRIRVLSLDVANGDEEALSAFIQLWTPAMAGYSDAARLESAVRAQLGTDATDEQVRAEMEAILLPAENRVRALLEYVDTTETLTFRFELEGSGGSGEPGVDITVPEEPTPSAPVIPIGPSDPGVPDGPDAIDPAMPAAPAETAEEQDKDVPHKAENDPETIEEATV